MISCPHCGKSEIGSVSRVFTPTEHVELTCAWCGHRWTMSDPAVVATRIVAVNGQTLPPTVYAPFERRGRLDFTVITTPSYSTWPASSGNRADRRREMALRGRGKP